MCGSERWLAERIFELNSEPVVVCWSLFHAYGELRFTLLTFLREERLAIYFLMLIERFAGALSI